ncbi:MAG: GNAT family N-acetyltransferase [Candidatus Acidiferrales bacterium]
MTPEQAEQIAALLNSRNQLQVAYTAARVQQHVADYLFEIIAEKVVACVEVKKVQWYQSEICHLSVNESHENKGLGKRLIRLAEAKAFRDGARIVQCTIRIGNEASERAFRRSGYAEVGRFFNEESGNYVGI